MSVETRMEAGIRLSAELLFALDTEFLEALRIAGLTVRQHRHTPRPDAWYFCSPVGEGGPYPNPEAALIEGVAYMVKALRHGSGRLRAREYGDRVTR